MNRERSASFLLCVPQIEREDIHCVHRGEQTVRRRLNRLEIASGARSVGTRHVDPCDRHEGGSGCVGSTNDGRDVDCEKSGGGGIEISHADSGQP